MKYISIGFKCSVKYNIDKYRGKSKTLFFDWLMTTMDSVIELLKCNNIKDILYIDNLVKDHSFIGKKTCKIKIQSLDFCYSIHDMPKYYKKNDIINFIEKYTRRFNRIIQYIKSNEKLCFIRYGKISNNQVDQFINIIKKINPKCNFTLIVITNKENINLVEKKHLLTIPLHIDIPKNGDWKLQYLNWDKNIFSVIEDKLS